MNDTTEQLIRELAEKFGTTTEHLWGVMVRQATVSATMDIIVFTVIGIVLLFAGNTLIKVSKREDFEDDPLVYFWVCIIILFAGMWFTVGLMTASDVLTRFVNPEYWALKQLLP